MRQSIFHTSANAGSLPEGGRVVQPLLYKQLGSARKETALWALSLPVLQSGAVGLRQCAATKHDGQHVEAGRSHYFQTKVGGRNWFTTGGSGRSKTRSCYKTFKGILRSKTTRTQ